MADTLKKQPTETLPYAIDFVNLLPTGESLATITSVTADPSGPTIASAQISGTQVRFTVAGGTNNTAYRIEAIVTTTSSYIIEGDGILFVTDET